jgi:hypothetical protein
MQRPQNAQRGGPRGFTFDRRGRSTTTAADREAVRAWFVGNLVDGWFVREPDVTVDDYEILLVGELPAVELEGADADGRAIAEEARIERFRNDTRGRRIEIAEEAEQRFSRKVSWGATAGSTRRLFTTASVPMMTRLHMAQRSVLDTLVDSGVARSRSDALAWCVELVGRNETEWIERLRVALDGVERARAEGPDAKE